MITDIVHHLNSPNLDLKMQCSSAIFKCASDKVNLYKFNLINFKKINKNFNCYNKRLREI